MEINHPETHAELTALYPQYEAALVTNDVGSLQRLFWHSEFVIRYGATENLHGIDEIEAFRLGRPATNLARTIIRLDIATFGTAFGTVNLEFEREVQGAKVRGRQSQSWVRLGEGWRIVAAHVSLLA